MCRSYIFLLFLIFSDTCFGDVLVFGHRGARGLMPENTLPAFEKAIDLGVDGLELDVVVSKDNQIVISHDLFISSQLFVLPDGRRFSVEDESNFVIYNMNYSAVRQFEAGVLGSSTFPRQERVRTYKPLLEELFIFLSKKKGWPGLLNIEPKTNNTTDNKLHPPPYVFAILLEGLIKKYGLEQRVIVQSFDVRMLREFRKINPSIKTSLLVGQTKNFKEDLKWLGFVPDYYSPYFSLLTKDMVASLHSEGVKVLPWTLNDSFQINSAVELGVDGFITDYPDLAIGNFGRNRK